MKSWQLLSIRKANTDVQPKTVGTIISQVMKMENRQERRGGVAGGCFELSKSEPDPGPAVGTHYFLLLFPSCRILKLFAVTLILRGTRGRVL